MHLRMEFDSGVGPACILIRWVFEWVFGLNEYQFSFGPSTKHKCKLKTKSYLFESIEPGLSMYNHRKIFLFGMMV